MSKESYTSNDNRLDRLERYYQFNMVVDLIILPIELLFNEGSTKRNVSALLDTGANQSCILIDLAEEIELSPLKTGKIVQGNVRNGFIYKLDFVFSENIIYKNIESMEMPNPLESYNLKSPYDLIIGMDIIKTWDLLISNSSGVTEVRFRVIK